MDLTTNEVILFCSILLLFGVFMTKFSSRVGLPVLVFFIGLGMSFGQLFYYDNVRLTQLIGVMALIVILLDGGMQTRIENVRSVLIPSFSLATLGVVLTAVIMGVCAKYILQFSWLEGLLFGAIVSSTDAAAVFSTLGNKNIQRKLSSTLEVESGTNDPMAFFLTIGLIELLQSPESNLVVMGFSFFWQMGLGIAAGYIFGKFTVWFNNWINLDSSGLYPVLCLAMAVFTFGFTSLLQGSGLLAVYILAVIMGNAELMYRHAIFRFNEGFAWIAQILMFILLGLLVFPEQLLDVIWIGLILSLLLMLVARPVSVFISTIRMKYTYKEKIFLSWSGLRGAVPIVLATYPVVANLENGPLLFNVVFFVVLTSVLVQGSSVGWLANKLQLVGDEQPNDISVLELMATARTNTDLLEVRVKKGSSIAGRTLEEVKLPQNALVFAVVREERLITPRGKTRLQPSDVVYVMVPRTERERMTSLLTQHKAD